MKLLSYALVAVLVSFLMVALAALKNERDTVSATDGLGAEATDGTTLVDIHANSEDYEEVCDRTRKLILERYPRAKVTNKSVEMGKGKVFVDLWYANGRYVGATTVAQ